MYQSVLAKRRILDIGQAAQVYCGFTFSVSQIEDQTVWAQYLEDYTIVPPSGGLPVPSKFVSLCHRAIFSGPRANLGMIQPGSHSPPVRQSADSRPPAMPGPEARLPCIE